MQDKSPHPLHRFRFLFLAGYLGLWAAVFYLTGIADWLFGGTMDAKPLLIVIVSIVALQLLFLLGAPHLRPGTTRGGRPMMISLAVGALFATLLSAGIIASIASLLRFDEGDVPKNFGEIIIAPLLLAWIAWLWIFALFLVGEWADRYRKLYRFLIAGTVLEMAITIPIDASVRRRTTCYCGEFSFLALSAGIVSTLWVLGPGIVLLFLARRMQRRETFGYCRHCGYDLRMLPSSRCPECGTEFEVAK